MAISVDPRHVRLTYRQLIRALKDASPDGRLPIGERTLRKAGASGELEVERVNNCDLVTLAAYEAWLERHRVPPPPDDRREEARAAARTRVESRGRLQT